MNSWFVRIRCAALILVALLSGPASVRAGAGDLEYPNLSEFPNPDLTPGPPPESLFGLWAKGRKCGIRSGRLRITARTLRFAGKPPVEYKYIPGVPHKDQGTLDFGDGTQDLTFDTQLRLVGDDGNPDHVYFPCFGPNPGWPPVPQK